MSNSPSITPGFTQIRNASGDPIARYPCIHVGGLTVHRSVEHVGQWTISYDGWAVVRGYVDKEQAVNEAQALSMAVDWTELPEGEFGKRLSEYARIRMCRLTEEIVDCGGIRIEEARNCVTLHSIQE